MCVPAAPSHAALCQNTFAAAEVQPRGLLSGRSATPSKLNHQSIAVCSLLYIVPWPNMSLSRVFALGSCLLHNRYPHALMSLSPFPALLLLLLVAILSLCLACRLAFECILPFSLNDCCCRLQDLWEVRGDLGLGCCSWWSVLPVFCKPTLKEGGSKHASGLQRWLLLSFHIAWDC